MNKFILVFAITSLTTIIHASYVTYKLCETSNHQTNSHRHNLRIARTDKYSEKKWSHSLKENAESYDHNKEPLLDEITGKHLITIAHAIKYGENIIDHQQVIQKRLVPANILACGDASDHPSLIKLLVTAQDYRKSLCPNTLLENAIILYVQDNATKGAYHE